ncbi:MAG: hypothetical protein F6K56_42795, partial [Moorea sp. SIO3G5]|nr:hypothetical protein [Moorena sp. SIO3G5]
MFLGQCLYCPLYFFVAAYASALNYLNVGLGLLAADTWTDDYDFTLAFYLEVVEAEYL